jgi:DNA-binding MarR family transcriptional regulator
VEVLVLVESHGECRVGEAAAELGLAANTVSSIVTRLVVAGLLTRTPDRRDRRAARLTLTAAGTRRLTAWRDQRRAVVVEALGALADADRAAVLAALPALGRLADAMGDDDG